MEYSDAHRVFLQVILKNRVLTSKQIKSTYERICNHYEVENVTLQSFVININHHLEELHMAIRKSIQEGDKEDVKCFVIINNLNNDSTRLVSSFTKQELGYLKKMVQVLITSEEGFLTETNAINLGSSQAGRMSATNAENLIDRLVEEKWLLRENGRLSLGALTVCELQSYIEQNFEDVCCKCYFCKGYTFKGHQCPECAAGGHRSCLRNYWNEMKTAAPKCPNRSCGIDWDEVELAPNKRSRRVVCDESD